MKQPAQLRNPNSPEIILKNLSYGMENNTRLAGLQEGSCYNLINFFVTESNSLQTITGYSKHSDSNGFKIISVPLSFGESGTSSTSTYTIATKNNQVHLCHSNLGGRLQSLGVLTGYSTVAVYRMLLSDTKILIYNGQDFPVLWDLKDKKFIHWEPIPKPTTAPTLDHNLPVPTDTDSFTIHIAVSFNSTIGHTEITPKAQVRSSIILADMTDQQHLNVIRPAAPAGATSWDVWIGIEEGESGSLLRWNKEHIPIATTTFSWNRNLEAITDRRMPTDNSTVPIIFNYANMVNSRIWITQVSDWNGKPQPYTVAWSGTGEDCFIFTSSVGGGFMDLELGSPNLPQCILMFRKNDGSTSAVCLTGGPTSNGKRFVMEPKAISISQSSSASVQGFVPEEQLSAVGTVGGWSAIAVDTFLSFLSAQGLISTMTNQNSFNILSNNNISLKIQNLIDDIHPSQYQNIQVCTYNTRVFWRLFKYDNTPYILCYDYIKNSFTIIDIPIDSIFIDTSITNRLNLGFVLNGELYYCGLHQHPAIELPSKLELNYVALGNARTHTQYGRLIESTVLFEHLEPGDIKFSFNGIDKDDIQLDKFYDQALTPTASNDEYKFYRARVRLYRDKIIADKAQLSIETKGLAFSVDEIHITYDPSPVDYAKNRFQRTSAKLSEVQEHLYWVLEPENWDRPKATQWQDAAIWDDNLYWFD